jgi:hypothetical protein
MEACTLDHEIRDLVRRGDVLSAATLTLEGYGIEILSFFQAALPDEEALDRAYWRFCEEIWRGLPALSPQCGLRDWAHRVAYDAAHRQFMGQESA